MLNNFIVFGCWNNGLCNMGEISNGLSAVMSSLMNEKGYKTLIVLGDNYYPDIFKGKAGGIKIKMFNEGIFYGGFECLSTVADQLNASVHLLTGNHEIDELLVSEHNIHELEGFDNSKLVNLMEENTYECLSLYLQEEYAKRFPNINLIGFEPSDGGGTLSEAGYFDITYDDKMMYIYLDTNIYTNDKELCGKSSAEFRKKVQSKIIDELSKHKDRLGVIFFGHVPLFTCKGKENKGSLCNNSELIYAEIFCNPDIEGMLGDNVYYICADTHYYQQSTITLINGVEIVQYIIGTGGADLDAPGTDMDACLSTSITKNEKQLPIPNKYILKVNVDEQLKTFGYLKCNVKEGKLTTDFVDVDSGNTLPIKIKIKTKTKTGGSTKGRGGSRSYKKRNRKLKKTNKKKISIKKISKKNKKKKSKKISK
jgi:hypothetical protein